MWTQAYTHTHTHPHTHTHSHTYTYIHTHTHTHPHTHTQMVYTLVNKGSNSLWEHALLDPHSKIKIKKPTSRDKLV